MGIGTESGLKPTHSIFPDESHMARSSDGSEPIRGGSVGFNRIFGIFKERSHLDHTPFANLILINGMTVFRNNYTETASDDQIKAAWEKDIELFALYLGAYRVTLAGGNDPPDQTQVVVYLPTYQKIPKELRQSHAGTKTEALEKRYSRFYDRYKKETGVLLDNPGVRVICIAIGEHDYPHRELYRYIVGAPELRAARLSNKVVMITSAVIDYFISFRIPSVVVWESYTAKFKAKETFGYRLDPSGDIPFTSLMLVLFGDRSMIRCVLDIKGKRFVRDAAKQYKFPMRSQAFILSTLKSLSNVELGPLSKYNFT